MAILWKLPEYLKEKDIKPYSLGKHSDVSLNTVYSLVKEPPQYLRLDTLDTLLTTLRELTGEPTQLTDILEYTDAKQVTE